MIASHHLENIIVRHVIIIQRYSVLFEQPSKQVPISRDICAVQTDFCGYSYSKKQKNNKTKRFSDVRALTIILFFLIVLFATYENSFRWMINLERTNPTKTSNFWDIFIELLLVK